MPRSPTYPLLRPRRRRPDHRLAARRPAPHTTYLVHGEEAAAGTLRDRIDRELGWTAVVPKPGEAVLVR
ncbi:MBL fold metallo-hydrolase RNA specificity domain-containing protein [Streptomyces virginiae]|uniref:MBL fold metallo-hydrolase RNA specificity domain-containing protein n=1 Tax=Streptomyces virginiae TaxID=1961 RepID=UPI003659DBF5